jgi:tetratricopeptide (TPR) repeat protein
MTSRCWKSLALPLLAALWLSSSQAQTTWTERETRLANEYLSLLVDRPEYGRVVDLLWDLYQKRESTQLLLDNIATQAQASKHPSVLLVQGHLLRKSAELAKAAAIYDEVLKLEPNNALALRARAEVANETGDTAQALQLQARLAATLPDNDPAKVEAWMQLGNLSLGAGKLEEAVQAWQAAVKLKPQDMALARTVAQLLLRAGYPDKAVSLLEALAKQSDPQKRLEALHDLARVHEHADQFAKADQALREGLSLLDFRDSRYAEFFLRRVRVHERFGTLDDLRGELMGRARQQPATENALFDTARFFTLTVDPDERLVWLRELVKAAPQVDAYRWELVRALLDHEGAAEAATILDEALKQDGSDLPALVLLRAEADLRQGKQEPAMQRLRQLIEGQGTADVEKQVLVFAQERSLDAVVELILQRRVARDLDKPEAAFELATYYRSRDRGADATKVLQDYAHHARTPQEQAQRLNDAATFLAAGGNDEEALRMQREAAQLSNGGREELVRLADLMAGSGQNSDAVTQLEAAFQKATSFDERADIDDRLYSLLMGEQKAQAPKKPAVSSNEFTLPSFITGAGFGSDEPANDSAVKMPPALLDHADRVLQAAKAPQATNVQRLRGIWWASRVERMSEAYALMKSVFIDPTTHQRVEQPVEVERLWLEVALVDENRLLICHQLRRLIERDPANRVQYRLRLAEQHLAVNVDELTEQAMVELERALSEQPDNESVLSALTQCYQLARQFDKALDLWRKAIERTPGNAGIPLRERYAELLMKANKIGDYVETQIAIVEAETDIKRRRDAFKRFVDRLVWSDASSGEVAPEILQERLKLVEGRLIERTRKHPFDGFFHEALAAVFEKRGDAQKAFASMKQAYYTSPDTPFSLDQLRAAALRAGDLKSAIYFQKQIVATAPAKELASESRQLIQLLEQTFQIAEADKVRRRLENRLSQDAQALEDLAQYYKDTGQDEAEKRVYEQVQRVRSWDPRSTLRLALKCIAVADEKAAEEHLRQLLAKTKARNSLKSLPPERWPFPLTDERKPGAAASLKELVDLLDDSRGLDKTESERLRAFLNYPRPEFMELPDDVSLVRLRGIEEMAKLMRRQGGEGLNQWIAQWQQGTKPLAIEKLWALYYAGANKPFQTALHEAIGKAEDVDLQFVHAWMTVRSQGMKQALAWMKVPIIGRDKQAQRRRLLQAVTGMMADWESFRYEPAELVVLGNARLLQNGALLDLVKRLQDRQRYTEAISLVECLRRQSPELWRSYSFVLSSFAQSAELWDLQRQYLHEVLAESPQPGGYSGEDQDPFLMSVISLHRLARTPQERDEVLQAALARLRSSPPSALTTMREAAVAGLAGAVDPAAKELGSFASQGLLGARTLGVPQGGLMPQGTLRGEDNNHLRSYWEDLRMIGGILSQQGLAPLVAAMDELLHQQMGSVQLGPKPSDTFSLWRSSRLIRQLRATNYPNRVRLIREHLAAVDMKEEDAVEALIELGRDLEVNGLIRECIEVYRLLPSRAPTNNLYAEYFIRVCEQAWEPGPGREYVESLFGKDPVYKPQGIGDEVLREKHARYLALQRDEMRLRELAWKREGFTRVLAGRIAHEVPYARELALLLEHEGDTKGALEAWNQMHMALISGTPDNPMPADPEAALHRAQLMIELKAPHPAHQALQEVPVKDALDEAHLNVLKLRAQLAAETAQWDDVRELMTVAVDKKSPELALAITDELHKARRGTEALNFLTQAERAMKGVEERFALRLEQLRFFALDATWTPERGRSQVAALFRTGGRSEATLKRFTTWFGQLAKQPPVAQSWIAVLKTEARGGGDPALAALGLCCLASQWPTSTLPVEVTAAWSRAQERDRPCVQRAAQALIEAGRAEAAWAACETLRSTPAGVQARLLPIAAKAAAAMKDEDRLRELYAEVVRMPFPGGNLTKEWAEAFTQAGRADWARELYELAADQMAKTSRPNPELTRAQIEFLIGQQAFEATEALLLEHYGSFIPESAALIVKLYRAWGRLAQIETELPKYFLPEGVALEVRFLSKE